MFFSNILPISNGYKKLFSVSRKCILKFFLFLKWLQDCLDNRYEYFVLLLYHSWKRNCLRISYILLASPGASSTFKQICSTMYLKHCIISHPTYFIDASTSHSLYIKYVRKIWNYLMMYIFCLWLPYEFLYRYRYHMQRLFDPFDSIENIKKEKAAV